MIASQFGPSKQIRNHLALTLNSLFHLNFGRALNTLSVYFEAVISDINFEFYSAV